MKNNKMKVKKISSLFSKIAIVGILVLSGMSCAKKQNEIMPKTDPKSVSSAGARLSGFTWTAETATGSWLSSSFSSASNGFIAGVAGAIAKTVDGGVTYTAITTAGTTNNLYTCYFLSSTKGFVAGDNNTFLTTNDGGSTWTIPTIPSGLGTLNYRGIYFFNSTIGFVTGGNGVILKTTDGGLTWALSNSGIPSTEPIYSVFFTDANNGHAGGGYGNIYKTTDGGATWTGKNIYYSRAVLSSIFFTSALRGYVTTSIGSPAVGDTSMIFNTTDGGATWTPLMLPLMPIVALSSIKFFDASNGYMVGGNVANNTGIVLSTTNGGVTWVSESIPSSHRFTGLSLVTVSPGNGFACAVGLNNLVLKGQ
ncbi:MAG TPA: YCF48-related protein [Cytophagaceae bacterium]|jgi:photosystem II stability/assembly factor-like uncharacterized protein|nr:YCF48-related protein [Cytophagaceae bacterium]